jgi:hypothetical protein
MDIYPAERWEAFRRFARSSRSTLGNRRNILSRPPLYTLSPALLKEILDGSGVSDAERTEIERHYELERDALAVMLSQHRLEDKLSVLSEKEFRQRPQNIPLPHRFGPIPYTWEQYSAHVEATLNTRRPNYRALAMAPAFRHIDAYIVKGSHAVICKHNEPGIQFVIRHPKLVSALENYVVVLDQD